MMRGSFIFGWILCVFLGACQGSGALSQTEEDTLLPQAGSIAGNPTIPKTSVTFKTTASASPECIPYDIDHTPASRSQICSLTPQHYNMGILAMYLIRCKDDSGKLTACSSLDTTEVTAWTELYQGEPVDLVVDENGTVFSQPVQLLEVDGTFSGIQMVVSYVEQRFPDEENDPEEAAKVMADLRGKAYRLCLTPENHVDAETLFSNCGNDQAHRGDYLVDINEDGFFGFIDTSQLSATRVTEVALRPLDYDRFQKIVAFFYQHDRGDEARNSLFHTHHKYFDVDGYFSPFFGFDEPIQLQSDTGYDFDITFDLTGMFRFLDGAGTGVSRKDLCIADISTSGCLEGDSDPLTPGVYNPFFDEWYTNVSLQDQIQVSIESAQTE